MNRAARFVRTDAVADPFGECSGKVQRLDVPLLGGLFRFESESEELLELVRAAYKDLPRHELARDLPRFRVGLVLTRARSRTRRAEPPPATMLSGAGFLCGTNSESSFAVLSPDQRSALVVVSPEMLRSAYHTRYELIEFAVYTLASRSQGLVPLHAACVGREGRGVLLIGPSGAGKSTVALHCLLQGFEFLSEDATFVAPEGLLATGVPNFLHVRRDCMRFLAEAPPDFDILDSPMIRRRSGVRKLEVDLRGRGFRLAAAPLRIAAVVLTSTESGGDGPILAPLSRSALIECLRATQPYAARSPGWAAFKKNIARVSTFELRRGRHPAASARVLSELLGEGASTPARRARRL